MATEDDSDVPETGAIFTFGKSKFGDNAPNKFWIRNDRVVEVACGDEHTTLVAESGRIFTFGSNDWGQLGLGHTKAVTKPSCVKSLKGEKVRKVGAGRSTTYVITESGRVYSFGANGDGQLGISSDTASCSKPQRIEGLQEQKYTMVSGGTDHAAVLSASGEVFVWGGGGEGQLGLGDVTEAPSPVRLPLSEAAVCVACGYYHTAVVTASGKLFTFGETEGGKLGLGPDIEENSTPQEVEGIEGKVIRVACGGSHTVAITETGWTYIFGEGNNGQLGHGNIQLFADQPQRLTALRSIKVKSASCGENHTAVITDRGELYTFGDGRHGKLGLGEENFTNQFKPSLVTRFQKFTLEQVSCGGCHMLALARPRMEENGDFDSGAEDSETGEDHVDHAPRSAILASLQKSEDFDLSGSFSARDRRREKQDPMGTLTRTLPPLNSSFGGRALPPLNGALPQSANPLNRSMLPPLQNEEDHQPERKKLESSSSEEEEEESEKHEKKRSKTPNLDVVDQESDETSSPPSEPVQKPVPAPRKESITPVVSPLETKAKKESESEEDDEEEETEDSEEEKPKQPVVKAKPVPVARGRPPRKPLSDESSEEEETEGSEEEEEEDSLEERRKQKHKERDKPPMRAIPRMVVTRPKDDDKDSGEETEEEEDSEEEEKEDKPRARGPPSQQDKKMTMLFGKKDKKEEESEEEESEEEEDEQEEEEKRKEVKSRPKTAKEKAQEKQDAKLKDKYKKKKVKDESEEEEEEEESEKEEKKKPDKRKDAKKKENENKNSKSKNKTDEEDEEEEEEDEEDEKDEKDKKGNKIEPEAKKKSSMCVIL